MTDCAACAEARAQVSHLFQHGCKGCAARAVSRGQNFRDWLQHEVKTRRYQAELDMFEVTHEDVLAARAADVLATGKGDD